MTQEEKSLLFKDLASRFPYGVMVLEDIDKEFNGGCISKLVTITEIKGEKMFLTKNSLTPVTIEEIRPYLRPMSSMTEEELDEYEELEWAGDFENLSIPLLDWFNKKMFDYRGLIDKGLAIEASDGMYNIK